MEDIIKSNQEQATSAIIEYLKQIRLAELVKTLNKENSNLKQALGSIDAALEDCHILIERNRGGQSGIHGFLAEAAQHGIGNAKEQIEGKQGIYEWINDNGEFDLIRNGTEGLQLKFYNGTKGTLNVLKEYLNKYPDFLEKGGKYQIPKDLYEKIVDICNMSSEEAKQLTKNSIPSIKEYEFVRTYFESETIQLSDIEASDLTYAEVQKCAVEDMLKDYKEELEERNHERKVQDIKDSRPTAGDHLKAGAIGAGLEGGTTFVLEISKKLKEKKIKDFTEDDWNDVLKKSGISTVKGGIRGVVVSVITNKSNLPDDVAAIVKPESIKSSTTPASIANAIVTASFGIAEQAYMFSQKKISEVDFIYNSEVVCLDASVSALSSIIGQTVIPIPVLGALIGNTVGTLMYKVAKDNFNKEQQDIIERFKLEQEHLDEKLINDYQDAILKLNGELQSYITILENSFDPNIKRAFEGSVDLAFYLGVPTEEILDSKEKIDDYFTA